MARYPIVRVLSKIGVVGALVLATLALAGTDVRGQGQPPLRSAEQPNAPATKASPQDPEPENGGAADVSRQGEGAPSEPSTKGAVPVLDTGGKPTEEALNAGVDLLTYVVKTLVMLGLLCVMAYATVRFLGPKIGPGAGSPGDLIKVIETRRIDPKTTLFLVEVSGHYALLATSDHQVRGLSAVELDEGAIRKAFERKAPQATGARTFASLIRGRHATRLATSEPSNKDASGD
ncbi:flagellar biosynthetic protein FliO [Planctomycetota bacterium]